MSGIHTRHQKLEHRRMVITITTNELPNDPVITRPVHSAATSRPVYSSPCTDNLS